MIEPGATAPDFELPGADPSGEGKAVTDHRLSDTLRNGPTLINFYLFDFHPGCTENLCDLHDLEWFDLNESVTAFGISSDGSFSHRAFSNQEQLGYALLSDTDGSVAESYDVLYDTFEGHRRIAKRSVFVVDSDRTVRYAWSTDDPSQQPNWTAVEEALRNLGVIA